jgi:tryptophanyl-tRNA synthetase
MAEPIANRVTLRRLVSAPDVVARFTDAYNRCEIRYGDLKKQLAEDIVAVVAPIRERSEAIRADEAYLQRVTSEGAERARASSSKTLAEVREIMGIHRF